MNRNRIQSFILAFVLSVVNIAHPLPVLASECSDEDNMVILSELREEEMEEEDDVGAPETSEIDITGEDYTLDSVEFVGEIGQTAIDNEIAVEVMDTFEDEISLEVDGTVEDVVFSDGYDIEETVEQIEEQIVEVQEAVFVDSVGEETVDENIEYRFPEISNIALGESFEITNVMECIVKTDENPEGESVSLEITNVTVKDIAISQDKGVLILEEDSEENGWQVFGEHVGCGIVTLTYKTIEGDDAEYSFNVHVTGNEYSIELYSETGNVLIVGKQLDLQAKILSQGYNADQGYYQGSIDDVTVEWSLVDGDEGVYMNEEFGNPFLVHIVDNPCQWVNSATVKASFYMTSGLEKELIEELEYVITLSQDTPDDDYVLKVSNPNPYIINGESTVIIPVLYDSTGKIVSNSELEYNFYNWDDWYDGQVEITDATGKAITYQECTGVAPFTIKKVKNKDVKIEFEACFKLQNGIYDVVDSASIYFYQTFYNAEFRNLRGEGKSWVFRTGNDVHELWIDTSALAGLDYEIAEWNVGWQDSAGWIYEKFSGDTYTVDGEKITLYGSNIWDFCYDSVSDGHSIGQNGILVEAVINVNGNEFTKAQVVVDLMMDETSTMPTLNDMKLDPGDSILIERNNTGYLLDSEYPKGVLAEVEVISTSVEDGNVVNCQETESGWILSAVGKGKTDVGVSYTYLNKTYSHGFTIYVKPDQYDILLQKEESSTADVTLRTEVNGSRFNIETQAYEVIETMDLSYRWSVIDGEDYIVLQDDGKMCHINYILGYESQAAFVKCEVFIQKEGAPELIGSSTYEVTAENIYYRLEIQGLGKYLEDKEMREVTPVLYRCTDKNPDGEKIEDAWFSFEVNPGNNVVYITDVDGEPYGKTYNDANSFRQGSVEVYRADNIACSITVRAALKQADGSYRVVGKASKSYEEYEYLASFSNMDSCGTAISLYFWKNKQIKLKNIPDYENRNLRLDCEVGLFDEQRYELKTLIPGACTIYKDGRVVIHGPVIQKYLDEYCQGYSAEVRIKIELEKPNGYGWTSYYNVYLKSAPAGTKSAVLTLNKNVTAKVVDLTGEDYVTYWGSSNPEIFTVKGNKDGTCIFIPKAIGTAKFRVKIKSWKNKIFEGTVTVQKGAVRTTNIDDVESKYTVSKGSTFTLTPQKRPITSIDSIRYQSSNTAIAKVSSKGVVTGVSAGMAIITITSGKITKKCTITVPGIRSISPKLTLVKGKTTTLKPVKYGISNKFIYTTSNKNIVNVNQKGLIKAISPGIAKITIKAGSYSVVCTVTVPGIRGVSSKLTLAKGKTFTFAPVKYGVSGSFKYSTSNKAIVNVNQKGLIKAMSPGTAKITIQAGSYKAVCTVTVPGIRGIYSRITLEKGKIKALTPVKYGISNGFKFSTSDKTIVNVNSKGLIKAISPGRAKITIQAGSYKAVCIVTVPGIRILNPKIIINKGKTMVLTPAAYGVSGNFTYSTSNKKVVNVNSKGLIKAMSPGREKITVKIGKYSAAYIVTVTSAK